MFFVIFKPFSHDAKCYEIRLRPTHTVNRLYEDVDTTQFGERLVSTLVDGTTFFM